jgi:hypothetical protein
MDFILITKNNKKYLECIPDGDLIDSETKALDLVAACGQDETDRLLIHGECLPDDFFDLRTGLAGTIMLKLSNYRIRAAVIAPNEKTEQGKFHEMMIETNRGNQFRIFSSREDAESWFARLE